MGKISRKISLLIIFMITVSSLMVVNPLHAQAQTAPTPTPTIQPTASTNPNQPTPTPTQPNPPTPSSAPNQPTPTPTPPQNITPTPTPNIEAINKPSVPEFTVKLVQGPYDVPSSYWISAFTGRNVTIPGTHIDVGKRAIVIAIKNQPFITYKDVNSGWNISIYYSVRSKLNYSENWTTRGPVEDLPVRTDSEYTFIVYENLDYYSIGSSIDFQIEAMEGYIQRVWNPSATNQLEMYPYLFFGKTSGWSNTQAITITDNSIDLSPSPSASTPTPPPRNPPHLEPWEAIAYLAVIIALIIILPATIILLIYRRKRKAAEKPA